MHLYRSTPGEGLAFFPPFLEGHGAFVCDQDLALTVRIRDLKRRLSGLHVLLVSDSGLHVSDVTEAPAAARDVDDAAPFVAAEGRWAATWAGNLDAAQAASASGLVMLCHSLLLEASRRLSPSSSSSFCSSS
jgi:hypothetical protein